jgi:hypothetical protein
VHLFPAKALDLMQESDYESRNYSSETEWNLLSVVRAMDFIGKRNTELILPSILVVVPIG